MNIIDKIKNLFKKPKIVVFTESDPELIKKNIYQILGSSFKITKEVLFVKDLKRINLLKKNYLIFNFDKNNFKKYKEKTQPKFLTFGFKYGADFQAIDLRLNGGTNFKVNYQGKTVPVWLVQKLSNQEIYSVLAAALIATLFGLNLVEISQALKKA